MKILILGAAGELAGKVTEALLKQTKAELVLYARDASKRLKLSDKEREKTVDGDFKDMDKLKEALNGINIVYLNTFDDKEGVETIVKAMQDTGVKRIIGATSLGIYDEVPGKFGEWNKEMLGDTLSDVANSTKVLEDSSLDYTLLRMSWLYNDVIKTKYELTHKGEPFKGAQVSRDAVAQLVVDIVKDDSKFIRESLGVGEPNTDWDKPSFY